ncbi:glycosyltransferase family 10, partial [Vibrio parahaemolyticus]|uniref:glycosyltransferase family 10 domain-containing protein n=1 Tax=Vibrio parahaemolyticus TaxID=670 RepID=UPI0020139719
MNSFFYRYKSYKGSVESKTHTLKNYKFCICFENAQMIEGYITEKIFDCFFSATVPIYWGA